MPIAKDPAFLPRDILDALADYGLDLDAQGVTELLARAAAALNAEPYTLAQLQRARLQGLPVMPPPSQGSDGPGSPTRMRIEVDLDAERVEDARLAAIYDEEVKPEYRSDQPGSRFHLYKADLERFEVLRKQIQWYGALPTGSNGTLAITLKNGLYRIWGRHLMTGLLSNLVIEGEGFHLNRVTHLTYGSSPRGAEWSEATLELEDALHPDVVVGMAYGSGAIESIDSAHGASGPATVTDHAAFANGAHIITAIDDLLVEGDRRVIKVDVPHPTELVDDGTGKKVRVATTDPLISPPGLIQTGDAGAALPAGQIVIPLAQLVFTGGFDGRRDEAPLKCSYGFNVSYRWLGLVDHTDPEITRDNGHPPDRKMLFGGNVGSIVLADYVVVAGGENHSLRTAKMVTTTINRSFFGAAGLRTRAQVGVYGQLNCFMDCTRVAATGYTEQCYLSTANSYLVLQNCLSANAPTGVGALGGGANVQSHWAFGCDTGFASEHGGPLDYNSLTVAENCGIGISAGKEGDLNPQSPPKFVGCTTDVSDLRAAPATFADDVTIDKLNPTLNFKHGSLDAYIRSALGALAFEVDSSARDVVFGHVGNEDLFTLDMGAKGLLVDGTKVLGTQRPAIADSGDPTTDAILAALRAHGLIAT